MPVGTHRLVVVALAIVALSAIAAAPASAQPVSCGQVVTQSIKLDSDLICQPSADNPRPDALVIGAPGITVNLNGHFVFGYHYAIRNDGYDDVVVRNGRGAGDYETVHLEGAERNTLRDLTLDGLIYAVRGLDVNRLSLIGSRTGFVVSMSGDGIVVRNNVFTGGMATLYVGGDGNDIVRNTSTNAEGAITAVGSHSRIAWNTITPSIDAGINLSHGDGNVVAHNSITGSPNWGWCGMVLEDVRDSHVRDNTVAYEQTAIWLKSGERNVFVGNHVANAPATGTCPTYDATQAPQDGLHVDAAASGTVLWGNVASKMKDDGFDVDAAGALLRRNRANDNGDLGIEAVPGVTDLGGNRASGNGNPLQCLNVVCK
jgi:large repetitive protein